MPKPKQPLNALQTEILLILYKFRFATRDLIVSYQELPSKTYTRERLINLMEQKYIGRHYTGHDKIAGKPARYYLNALGIRFLLDKARLDEFRINPGVLNLAYKDKNATEQFMERSLSTFELYIVLKKLYGDSLDFYTKSELAGNKLFLKPLPDAYLTFSGRYNHKSDYIIEIMDSTKPYFVHRRRLNQYLKQYEANTWQNTTNANFPRLLLIADSPNLERRLQKSMIYSLSSRSISELAVYTTTLGELLMLENTKDKVLSNIYQPEKLLTI